MPYVNYIEFHVGDVEMSRKFYSEVFRWDPKPWADDYLVASHGTEPGLDTGITPSPDGEPVTVATIMVDDLAGYMAKVIMAGGEIVVPRFAIPDVGDVCYFTDPTGMLVGLMQPEE